MGIATRLLPSQQAKSLVHQPVIRKAKFLEQFSCDFPGEDGVQATLAPLSLENAADAGLRISVSGVRRYFRLLVRVRPGDATPGKQVVVRARLRANSKTAGTIALAHRDPITKGWNRFPGQLRQLPLNVEWSPVVETFAAESTVEGPVAVVVQLTSDAELEIAEFELTSSVMAGNPGRPPISVSTSATPFTAPNNANRSLSSALNGKTPAGASGSILDEKGAAERREQDLRTVKLELAQSRVLYERNTLSVSASFYSEKVVDLSGVAVDLVAGSLVLQRGSLSRLGNEHRLDVEVPCSRRTTAQPLSLHSLELQSQWSLSYDEPAVQASLAPELVPYADIVEGSFDGIVTRRGVLVATGWCRDRARPDAAVVVDLFAEGLLVASGFASAKRRDVERRRGGSPVCGFNIEIPPNLACGETLNFEIHPRARVAHVNTRARAVTIAPVGNKLNERSLSLFARLRHPRNSPKRPTYAGIVLTQDGAAVLQDLLASVERFEVNTFQRIIIIDHESIDETAAVVRSFSGRLPVEFVTRPRSSSFSESNNFAARLCSEDVLVLLNNDLVFTSPIVHELGRHLAADVGLVGLKLMDPEVTHSQMRMQAQQHVGVHFSVSGSREIRPFESRSLTDSTSANQAPIDTPAVTAALVAIERTFFSELQGFDESFFYGYEDIDLCLRSLAAGRGSVCVNNASAVHVRGYSRRTLPAHLRARRKNNTEIFLDRWSYTICRSMLRELFNQVGFWTGRKLHVGFVVTEANPETAAGDYMTALDFARAFGERYPSKMFFYNKAERVDATSLDLLIVMVDDFNVSQVVNVGPCTLLVAWPRNWFHRWVARPWRERFDYWFASSDIAAEYLESELGRNVSVVPIGTDPQRFAEGKFDRALEADVAFTGHYWGSRRDIMSTLEVKDFTLKIFGKGWEEVLRLRPYHAGVLPYARMADVYKSTKVVVDDSNFATASWGSLNSRVFDALAAGALVLTNNVNGSQCHFDGLLPTYSDRESLANLIRKCLDDTEWRLALAEKLRKKVLAEHTYGNRVERLTQTVRSGAASGLRMALKIAPPGIDRAEGWGDWYFALSLRRELEKLGHHVRIDCLADWESDQAGRDDVNIVLRGLSAFKPKPWQINVMWLISHPNRVSIEELEAYDHIFVASKMFSERLTAEINKPVEFLPQCTDPSIFFPSSEGGERGGIVFVGNSRMVKRPAIQAALENSMRVDLYGDGWIGLVDESLVRATVVNNELVGRIYRNARIVLNDHWDDMRRWGFVSNRIFDALACGAEVVSDAVPGLSDLFGDAVHTFSDATNFGKVVTDLTVQPSPRRAQLAAERVLSEHTFKARAHRLDALVRRLDSERDTLASALCNRRG